MKNEDFAVYLLVVVILSSLARLILGGNSVNWKGGLQKKESKTYS